MHSEYSQTHLFGEVRSENRLAEDYDQLLDEAMVALNRGRYELYRALFAKAQRTFVKWSEEDG